MNEANTTETKGLLETVRSRDIESSRQQKTVSQLREQLHTSDTENKQRYKVYFPVHTCIHAYMSMYVLYMLSHVFFYHIILPVGIRRVQNQNAGCTRYAYT